MKRCKTMQAFGLFGVTALVSLCAARSAVAQDLTETERRIVQELEKSQQGLNSWKCTGIASEEVTQQWRDMSESVVADAYKHMGRTPPPRKKGDYTGHSFDFARVFFAAKKGDSALYAERKLRTDPQPYTPPDSTAEALKEIRKTGAVTFSDTEKSYEVTGEITGDLNRQTQRNQKGAFFLPAINEGFAINHIGKTPREAIVNHGFRFVEEKPDPKYGKVLVFRGRNPRAKEKEDVLFHLAPQFGYRVVYSADLKPDGSIHSEHRITSLVNVKGHFLPAESEDASYIKLVDLTKPDRLRTLRFAHHTVNDVSDDILKIKLKSGDYEWNEEDNTTYKVGANNERLFQDDSQTSRPRKPLPSWLYPVSVMSLLVLTVIAYIRWKRKQ